MTAGLIDEKRVRRFEAAWVAGAPESVLACLPDEGDPSRLPTLEELVRIELEFAWARWAKSRRVDKADGSRTAGAPPLLEKYLEEFPALDDSQRLTRLLQQEYHHRLDAGIRSPLSEYCQRFPALFENEDEAALLLRRENSLVDSAWNDTTLAPSAPRAVSPNDETLGAVSLEEDGKEDVVREVAGYRIMGELGRGGMGLVYKALDPKLNRVVALKMVLAGDHAGPEDHERFQREARAIAQLQHPHIVQIFEVGEENGLPFFVLEFIRGGSLDRQVDGKPRNPRQAADLVETLALAMQSAHEQGIIHRDLKPANVLMAPGRTPKITDFGLAKQLEDSQGQTATGAVIGTPSYMAPEQASGDSQEIGPAADIYALGAILYTLITGRPPFQGETAFDTIMQVIEQEALPPTRLQSKIPRDLETICLKCLLKDPERRYETAQALADDLRRFLEHRPIVARPIGWVERGVKWVRRKPAIAALVGLLMLSPLVGWGFIVNNQRFLSQKAILDDVSMLVDAQSDDLDIKNKALYGQLKKTEQEAERANREAKAAQAAETVANRKTKEAKQNLALARAERERLANARYKADMGMAASDWEQHNLKRLAQRLRRYERADDGVDRRHFEWFFWKRRNQQDLLTFTGHTLPVVSIACSPDGKWIASGSLDKTVRLWDTTTGKVIRTLAGHTRPVSYVAVSPDGKTLLSSGLDGAARFWNVADGKQVASIEGVSRGEGIAFAPDGKTVAIATDDKSIRFWTSTGQPLPQSIRPQLDEQRVRSIGPLVISDDGRYLGASCLFDDPAVVVFDLAEQKQLNAKSVNWPRIFDLAFNSDGKQLAITGRGVQLWDRATESTRPFKPHGRWGVRSIAFSGSGQRLITAGNDLAIRIWDADSPDRMRIRLGHQRPVISLALHPDRKHLFSGSEDATIKFWTIADGRDAIEIPEEWESEQIIESASRMILDRESGRLFVATSEGQLLIVNPKTGIEQVQEVGSGQVMALAAVPRSGHVVTGFRNGQVVVWDPMRKRSVHTLEAHEGIVYGVAVSPDGRRLATGGQDQAVRLWDLDNGTLIHDLPWEGNQVRGVAFHPQIEQLAAVGRFGDSKNESVILWNYKDRKSVRTFEANGAFRFHCVAISSDGRWLAAGDSRGAIWVWDVAKNKSQTCSGHIAGVRSLQFSSDARRLASSGGDGTIRLWDPVDGTELLKLGDEGSVPDVVFSGDGHMMISLSPSERTIHFWDGRPMDSAVPGRDDKNGTADADEPVPTKDARQ